jgi:hypothetical protein
MDGVLPGLPSVRRPRAFVDEQVNAIAIDEVKSSLPGRKGPSRDAVLEWKMISFRRNKFEQGSNADEG